MTEHDYYEIIGVARDADAATIKKSYRSLVMQFHPDKNQDDPTAKEKMQEINEAYAVLSDPEKRRLYDRYGHEGLKGYSQEDIFRGVDFADLFSQFGRGDLFGFENDLFGGLFGRKRRGQNGPQRGADLRYDLVVTLEEMAFGAKKDLKLPKMEQCQVCKGTGAEEGGVKECDQCHGTGQTVIEQRKGPSVFRQITVCGKCHGKGTIIMKPCKECQGQGSVRKTKEIAIEIPAGVDSGYAIKVDGEGQAGKDLPGDLYVVLEMQEHPLFERHGDDLYIQKDISFTTAALGGQIEVAGLDGTTSPLDIPEGTQTGAVFRLAGQGVPHAGRQDRGFLYVVTRVVTPTGLSEEQKRLLRELEQPATEKKTK